MSFVEFSNRINDFHLSDLISFKNHITISFTFLLIIVSLFIIFLIIEGIKEQDVKYIVAAFIWLGVILLFGFFGYQISKLKINDDVYVEYMESQEDLIIQIDDYNLFVENDGIFLDSRISNLNCEDCPVRMVTIYMNDKKYKMNVLIKEELEENEKAYILTKPRLKESVGRYKKEEYYNPILYVPRNSLSLKEI